MALPEGYIAQNEKSTTWAVDSTTLSRNGDVHAGGAEKTRYSADLTGVGNTSDDLDAFVEFNVNEDPRLDALRVQARDIGRQYSDPGSPDYIADVHVRDSIITNKLTAIAGEVYGTYSNETLNIGSNAEERSATGTIYAETAELRDMEKGSLVCRHMAPIMSVLLHEAGIENHLVTSRVSDVTMQNTVEGRVYALAENVGAYYAAGNGNYIPDREDRGQAIVTLALQNFSQFAGDNNKELNKSASENGSIHERLDAMTPDLARATALALKRGGVEDDKINTLAAEFSKPEQAYALDESKKPGYHMYVVTRHGAIVEGTTMGTTQNAYNRIVNDTTVEKIVYHGHAALAEGSSWAYGGGTGDGDSMNRKNVAAGVSYSIERHNDSVNRSLELAVKPIEHKALPASNVTFVSFENAPEPAAPERSATKPAEQPASENPKIKALNSEAETLQAEYAKVLETQMKKEGYEFDPKKLPSFVRQHTEELYKEMMDARKNDANIDPVQSEIEARTVLKNQLKGLIKEAKAGRLGGAEFALDPTPEYEARYQEEEKLKAQKPAIQKDEPKAEPVKPAQEKPQQTQPVSIQQNDPFAGQKPSAPDQDAKIRDALITMRVTAEAVDKGDISDEAVKKYQDAYSAARALFEKDGKLDSKAFREQYELANDGQGTAQDAIKMFTKLNKDNIDRIKASNENPKTDVDIDRVAITMDKDRDGKLDEAALKFLKDAKIDESKLAGIADELKNFRKTTGANSIETADRGGYQVADNAKKAPPTKDSGLGMAT